MKEAVVEMSYSIVLLEWHSFKRVENYSLGLFYIHESLRERGYCVNTLILDGDSCETTVDKILSYQPDIVGIKFYGETAIENFLIVQLLKQKKPQIKIVLGGHCASLYSIRLLKQNPLIDVITRNESERTYIDLCEHLIANKNLITCQGIAFRQGNQIFKTEDRALIADLDEVTSPNQQLFLSADNSAGRFIYYAMSTARGCVGNCYFCASNNMYKNKKQAHWRGMSTAKILTDIRKLADAYPDKLKFIKFLDSSFEDPNPKLKQRLREVVSGLIQSDFEVAFSFYTRAESWIDESDCLIKDMKKAGLHRVYIGYDESIYRYDVNEFTSNAISAEKVKVNKAFVDNGIRTTCYLITFHPFISIDNLIDCADFLEQVNGMVHPDVWTHKAILYPDSKLFMQVANAGLLLGMGQDGYCYEYGFADGRVAKLYSLMVQVEQLESYSKIRSSLLKLDMILDICDAWANRDITFRKATGQLSQFVKEIEQLYYEMGLRQKKLFYQALIDIKEHKSIESDLFVSNWDEIYKCFHVKMEKQWMNVQLNMVRKKIL